MNKSGLEAAKGVSRRAFVLGTAAAAGGGLALGVVVPGVGVASAQTLSDAGHEIGAWVVIQPDGTCVVRVARSEMGQGTSTGLAQLVAEELDCDWSQVRVEYPTPGQSLARGRAWGDMGTGGSWGIRKSDDYVRKGGAAARLMLVAAAARELGVASDQLETHKGVVSHPASGRTLSYGRLAKAASELPVPDPKTITLRDPRQWKLAGQPLKRVDTLDKLNGKRKFSIDVRMPGMLYAAVKASPVFGGSLVSFDSKEVEKLRGVVRVVRVDRSSVAVVADSWWRAKVALDKLPIVWDNGPHAAVNDRTLALHVASGLSGPADHVNRNETAADAGTQRAARTIEATYTTPFLAHGALEPVSGVARVTKDRAEAWIATQNGEASLAALAKAAGLPPAQCEVYKIDLGGSFGRRTASIQDYVEMTVAIAKQFPGVAVKMIWSREEDQTHDFYRPLSQSKMTASLDADGQLASLNIRVSGPSINKVLYPQTVAGGNYSHQLQGFWKEPGEAQLGYTIPNLKVDFSLRETPVPIGTWRGVNTNQNGVYLECFIEEVARAAGQDSLKYRRALLKNHPKHLAVLEAAADRAGWGTPLPAGIHRGMAQFMGYGSYCAAVAEVMVNDKREVKVRRVVMAINCGHAVNPDQIAAQVEGAVYFGLGATFFGEISIEGGRVKETNFDAYRVLRMAEAPKVETVLMQTYDFWGGVGEPPIAVVAPAVMNAVFAATGKPVRDLPLKNQGFSLV